jgi:peptidyl-prolyl cis-trans isomerase C
MSRVPGRQLARGVDAALIVLAAALGCSPPEAPGADSGSTAGRVATVEGETLAAEDLRLAPSAGPEERERALDQAILRRLAAAEARRRGLDREPEVTAKLRAIEREARTRKEAALQAALFGSVREGLSPSEEALRAHYEATKLRYAERQLRLRRRPFASREAAERALGEVAPLEGEGAETIGPSPVRELPRTVLPEALRLERPGERSVAGSAEEGWSLIELAEVLPAEPRPFEAVRSEVEASLRQKEATAAFRALLDELRAEADVRVDEGALARLSASADAGVTSERPQGRSLRR